MQHLAVLRHVPYFLYVVRNSLSSTRPKCIQSCPDNHAFKDQIINLNWINQLPSYVLTLTFGALKRHTQMVPWTCLLKTNFILKLSQGCTIEVLRHLDIKIVQRVDGETKALTDRKMTSVQAIVCADNTRLKGHSL
jgi:hypothetical protein